tara:strand:+ start:21851 stop:22072 length:222 start_codon:yes stop_codon:yes gene_type:complete
LFIEFNHVLSGCFSEGLLTFAVHFYNVCVSSKIKDAQQTSALMKRKNRLNGLFAGSLRIVAVIIEYLATIGNI